MSEPKPPAANGAEADAKKPPPGFQVKIQGANRLNRDTSFLCDIRFRNTLPEIPSDPKMLLAPLNPHDLAAFRLTTLETDLRRDMLFEPDLGIPLTMLDIERYSVPEGRAPPLHPADAALLEDRTSQEAAARRGRLRGDAAELSWLLRTKYMTAATDEPRRGAGATAAAAAAKEGGAGAREGGEAGALVEGREALVASIEATFAAAARPPVHARDPSLRPLEVLPVLPDELFEGRSYVLGTFDHDPTADVPRMERLPPAERARTAAAAQLKSFAQRRPDGSMERFVAYLLPATAPPAAAAAGPGGGEGGAAAGPGPGSAALALAAADLARDYEWVRVYDSTVRLDDKGQTYLFRLAGGHVGYTDLNMKLVLRKRKRKGSGAGGEEEEDAQYLRPEKVSLRLPGGDAGAGSGGDGGGGGAGGSGQLQPRPAAAAAPEEQRQAEEEEEEEEGEDDGGVFGAAAAGAGSLRTGLGDDEEDDL